MQFALSQEQTILRGSVERFVTRRYDGTQRRAYRAAPIGYSLDNWRELAELGLLGVPFSTDDGGLESTPLDLISVMEVLGAGFVVEPVLEELVLAGGLLARAGETAQKQQWLPRIISGEAHLCVAHFEHSARFNLSDVRVRVQSRAGRQLLDGEKMVVPLAAAADQWIVSARRDGANSDPDGIVFYLVSPDTPGIERRDFRLADGSIASAISFRAAAVAEKLRGGFADFQMIADLTRVAAGAEMLGIMTTLFNSTLDYLRTRKQFGAPLSSFQALQHRLADLYVRLEQSRSHVFRAAFAMDDSAKRERSVAGMKSYVGSAAIAIGEACVHLHGGIGTTDDLAIGHGYKRLLVLANLFGDANAELTRFNRLAG